MRQYQCNIPRVANRDHCALNSYINRLVLNYTAKECQSKTRNA